MFACRQKLKTLIISGLCCGFASFAAAHDPPVFTIERPPAYHHGQPTGPQVQPLPAQPYPYGYFGATRRDQWGRHFGYTRQYTQWSSR